MRMQIAYYSNIGKVQRHNEDRILGDESLRLVVLADGMGGHQAGEVASKLAVETVFAEISTQLHNQPVLNNHINRKRHYTTTLLEQAILKANSVIYKMASQQVHYQGMGTTIVAALFNDDLVSVAHVGDSRLYRLRGNDLKAITKDHSVLQELIDCGFFTQEQARNNPNRHLITRALGINENVNVDVQEYEIQSEDLYLLCSDGLSDMLDNKDIHHILLEKKHNSLEEISQSLVDAANERGGADNISVAVTRFLNVPNKNPLHWLKKLFLWKL